MAEMQKVFITQLQDGSTGQFGSLYFMYWMKLMCSDFTSLTIEIPICFMTLFTFPFQSLESFIYDNLISNLEPLAAIQMPNLRLLDLRRNLIMNIRTLIRCQFNRLEQLNLSDNIILSCKVIADCYFPEIKRITIEQKTQPNIYLIYQQGRGQRELKSNSGVNGYDLRWIMKLETKNLELLKYSADARILRKGLEEQIGAKYYKIRAEKKGMQMGSLFPLVSF